MTVHTLYQVQDNTIITTDYVPSGDMVRISSRWVDTNGEYIGEGATRNMDITKARKHYKVLLEEGYTTEQPAIVYHQLQWGDKHLNFTEYEEAEVYKDTLPKQASAKILSFDLHANRVHRDGSYMG